jgi:hypothetical protein
MSDKRYFENTQEKFLLFIKQGGSIMRTLTGLSVLLLAFMLIAVPTSYAQDTARLQVIHNAADPAAEIVDIYLDETLLLDDFEFRAATEFMDAPAGVEFMIGVAPSNSMSSADAIATIPVTLEKDKSYVAVANGVLDPSQFAANPDGLPIGFELIAQDGAREQGMSNDKVDIRVLHGATDAPAVDVIARDVATLVEGAPYAAMTDYISVPAAMYLLDITPAGMNETVVATFSADLSELGGGAAVVFASGFLDPMNNMDGKAFGLFAALPTGDVVELPAITSARLQVIHNAADPGAASVDIYVNEDLLLDDFVFRAASPYIDAPAGEEFVIGVAPPNSMSAEEAIAQIPVTLMAGETYVAIANGVLDPMSFAENPDGREIAFELLVKKGTREMSMENDTVDFIVLHGATDAPAVDVLARNVGALVEGAAYTDITDYISVPAGNYILDITPAAMNETIVASFEAPLSSLGGGAAVVFASGFLAPENNLDGEAFGLYAALPNGDVLELTPALGTSVEDDIITAVIREFALQQNYPNPFNPTTTISYAIPERSNVKVIVYDMLGKEVATLVNDEKPAGAYNVVWNGLNNEGFQVSSGIYFYALETENFSETRRMMLVK